ncbi:hypothetical protein K504DRAFT_460251 [Pleomassaria siparia CBS 279.74]|uniref:RING-type domain-containing protein n=1 Tax=Pleomassaria siparia CBS 279.74 TaxID=1314801 RepID=A0A6G1JY27_9PLEO|nr:hypothetical protein K504DRAFT_460251 [Pleomassaria siparia CBS 279.74]
MSRLAKLLVQPPGVDTAPVDLDSVPDDHCFVCKTIYNTVDDPDDPEEQPESPVQIHPCNHILGERCLDQWIATCKPIPNCPMCRVELTVAPPVEEPFITKILLAIANLSWFQIQDRLVGDLVHIFRDLNGIGTSWNGAVSAARGRNLRLPEAGTIVCYSAIGATANMAIMSSIPMNIFTGILYLFHANTSVVSRFHRYYNAAFIINSLAYVLVVACIMGVILYQSRLLRNHR